MKPSFNGIPIGYKKCNQCLEVLELTKFYKRFKESNQYRRMCKTCNKENEKRYSKDLKRTKELALKWAKNNPIKKRKIQTKYRINNKDKVNALNAKYRADKIQRTPSWLTKGDVIEINWAYTIASQLSDKTGIKYVVDHIIPLKGKNISGLHVPQNLQIITQHENCKKYNKEIL